MKLTTLPRISIIRVLSPVLLFLLLRCPSARGLSDAEVCNQLQKECKIVHEWRDLQYIWSNKSEEDEYRKAGLYNPKDGYISGISLYKDEIYVTVLRIQKRNGVPAVLNKVVKDPKDNKYKLKPFPDLQAQKLGEGCSRLQNAMSIEIDPLNGHLYVLDPGRPGRTYSDERFDNTSKVCYPKLVIFDIEKGGAHVYTHILKNEVNLMGESFMSDFVLDRGDPASSDVRWVYIADSGEAQLYIVDFQTTEPRSVHDDTSMAYDEEVDGKIPTDILSYRFNVAGRDISGMAMSRNFDYLYYSALGSRKLWRIPTSALRDETVNITDHVQFVGDKQSRSDGMLYATHSLFYGSQNGNAVYRWETHCDKDESEEKNDTREIILIEDKKKMIYPDSFAVGDDRYLYFTANRANLYLKGGLDFTNASDANYRIWKVNIEEDAYLAARDNTASQRYQISTFSLMFLILLLLHIV